MFTLVPQEFIDYQDSNGNTLLHIVASHNDIVTLMYLIERGANMNISNNKGWTPLMYASRYNCTECVQALIANSTITFTYSKL